ncbi:interferon regulatory factor 3-like, partial [Clarias magur]
MAQPKPLFIPWLKQQIDSGQYPGVQWVNQECTKFSIPWKHGLRQDSNSDDNLIFKAWAQTSAGSNGQIAGDPSVWKRNFRSALRIKGFKIVEDNKNDTANPHKIYRWPDDTHSVASACSTADSSPVGNIDISPVDTMYLAEEELFPDGTTQPDLLQMCLADLNIVDSDPELPVNPVFLEDPLHMNPNRCCDAPFPIQETSGMNHFSPVHGAMAGAGQIPPAEDTLMFAQYSPLEGAIMGTQEHIHQANHEPVQSNSNYSGENPFGTHFQVNVYYRGKQVLSQLVENEAGFCLVFRNDPNQLPSALPAVQLPGTESILDQTQAETTQTILNNLGGLEVRQEGSKLMGYRWGDSRIYWGLDKHEQGPTSRAVSKIRPEPIYSFKRFVSDLMAFIDRHGKSPSYALYFFLGQQWPDPKRKPWEKKFIMVELHATCSQTRPVYL